jgi:hypothetical protein
MSINSRVFGQVCFFSDEVAQVMMWQDEVATHVGPTLIKLGKFPPKVGPISSPNT